MSEPKLTPWFDGKVRPVHVGVYEVDPEVGRRYFSHWDGSRWNFNGSTVERAHRYRGQMSSYDITKWRGLAEQPKGAA